MLNTIKKEFQKLIKEIRENGNEYPKAMMTGAQMEKSQATVNCGYFPDESKAIADKLMTVESFKTFLNKYEATAHIEYDRSKDAYQIRIKF